MLDGALETSKLLAFGMRNFDINVCLYLATGFSYPFSDLIIAGLRKLVMAEPAYATISCTPDTGRAGWRFAE